MTNETATIVDLKKRAKKDAATIQDLIRQVFDLQDQLKRTTRENEDTRKAVDDESPRAHKKDFGVGDVVRITDGIGKGQAVEVLDLVDLPFGTGVVVDLDGGYRETLNPANVEVIEVGSPEDVNRRITALEDQQATLLRSYSYHFNRVDGCIGDLTDRIARTEEAMRGHEKNVHEPIRERLADLESTLFKHLEKIYDRLEVPAPDKSNNDVTTENVATRDTLARVWPIYDQYQAEGQVERASFEHHADYATDATDDAEPHLPTPERRDPRIDGPLGDAYARYDGDDRVNGPDDFTAFADAVDSIAPYVYRKVSEVWVAEGERTS